MLTQYYNNRINELEKDKGNSRKKINSYSIIRLIIFSFLVIITILIFNYSIFFGLISLPISIIIFAFLVKFHNKKEEELRKAEYLIKIYQNEIRDPKDDNIFGCGKEFVNHTHLYTSDLDVFGNFSLFNFINRAVTSQGANKLADWLKQSSELTDIIARQKSLKELSGKIIFKEEFLRTFFLTKANEENSKLKDWVLNFQAYFLNKTFIKIFAWISPILIVISFILGYIFPYIWLVSFVFISTNLLLLTGHKNAVQKTHSYTSKQAKIFKRYAKLISLIKKENFNNTHLNELKAELISAYNPEKEFKKISRIAQRFDNRYNIIFQLFFSPIFLWDFHISIQTEKWFEKNKKTINNWLEIIGEFDALLSLSIVHYNNPNWVFPDFTRDDFCIDAKDISHPLIPEKTRIASNYSIKGKEKTDIITGSNMAGKSTFLRTVGTNMVLAYAGAPVCAKYFKLSKTEILTYFRIHDSLEESTSSFYAELKRIKNILNYIKTNNNAILLLDELLRGTNSNDRYLGSVAIIKQILKYKAFGIVATHDLKLADLEKEFPEQIRNFNFDVNVKNEELFFDYKLKDGICKSFNATLLMKKIGIEMNDPE
jgi:DNA mismatch repair ATPase MutS